jgi:hypothetical protein
MWCPEGFFPSDTIYCLPGDSYHGVNAFAINLVSREYLSKYRRQDWCHGTGPFLVPWNIWRSLLPTSNLLNTKFRALRPPSQNQKVRGAWTIVFFLQQPPMLATNWCDEWLWCVSRDFAIGESSEVRCANALERASLAPIWAMLLDFQSMFVVNHVLCGSGSSRWLT